MAAASDVLNAHIADGPSRQFGPAIELRNCQRLTRAPETIGGFVAVNLYIREDNAIDRSAITRKNAEAAVRILDSAMNETNVADVAETFRADLQCATVALDNAIR